MNCLYTPPGPGATAQGGGGRGCRRAVGPMGAEAEIPLWFVHGTWGGVPDLRAARDYECNFFSG